MHYIAFSRPTQLPRPVAIYNRRNMPSPQPAQPQATPVLQVHGLCFAYPQCPVYTGLDLHIHPGVTWLQGDDGSGKTTLLRLLAGALTPSAGRCLLNGQALTPALQEQDIFWADPQATALENTVVADYFASLPAQHPAFNTDLLTDITAGLSLTPHLHKPLYMLSTGSKRKVWLAAAFASGATVTLLDDPLAALDGASAALILELLEEAADHPARAWVVGCHEPLVEGLGRVVDLGARRGEGA